MIPSKGRTYTVIPVNSTTLGISRRVRCGGVVNDINVFVGKTVMDETDGEIAWRLLTQQGRW